MASGKPAAPGVSLIIAGAIIGTAVSVYNYLAPDNGINGTPGVLLVIASTFILFGFGLILRANKGGAFFRTFIVVSALLNIAGTAFAAYLLESRMLLGLMVVCLLGWLLYLFTPRPAPA